MMTEKLLDNLITDKTNLPVAEKENPLILPINKILGGGRLALIVTTLGWGGTERYVEDLSIAYAHLGMKPLIIVDSPPLARKDKMDSEGVEIIVLNVPINIKRAVYYNILEKL